MHSTAAATALASPPALLVNDVHSKLNLTKVREVVAPRCVDNLRDLIADARADGASISIAGGRHARGGQQFGIDGVLLDMSGMGRVLAFNPGRGTVEVEAGIQWPQLVAELALLQQTTPAARRWGIRQKQTGADRLSLGGALSANVHGRGLRMPPIVGDVESFTLVNADGRLLRCSRSQNADLFRLAIGGYGLFGVIATVELRLNPRRKVRRVVREVEIEDVIPVLHRRVDDGFLYGDFQFAIDSDNDDFLRRGIISAYVPVDDDTPIPEAQKELAEHEWCELLRLAHVDKWRGYQLYRDHYLATDGQVYWSDLHQLTTYVDDYHSRLPCTGGPHGGGGSEMITEVYVPRERLTHLFALLRDDFRPNDVNVIYGTVRLIEPDRETFLPWARERFACLVLNLHVDHTPAGLSRTARDFRRVIDYALRLGGSYYLTYHRFATREQLLAAYPQFPRLLELKAQYDPAGVFQSDWYRHALRLVTGQPHVIAGAVIPKRGSTARRIMRYSASRDPSLQRR